MRFAYLGVPVPQFRLAGEHIDHLGPFPLPLRMVVPIQNAVRHVAGADDHAGHDPGDLVTGTSQSQHRPREDALPLLALGH